MNTILVMKGVEIEVDLDLLFFSRDHDAYFPMFSAAMMPIPHVHQRYDAADVTSESRPNCQISAVGGKAPRRIA